MILDKLINHFGFLLKMATAFLKMTHSSLVSASSFLRAVNWYAYVNNNPVIYVDPTGETSWVVDSNGSFTAESRDTLFGLYGDDWKEASDFGDRDPGSLRVEETVDIPSLAQELKNYSIGRDERAGPLWLSQNRARNNKYPVHLALVNPNEMGVRASLAAGLEPREPTGKNESRLW